MSFEDYQRRIIAAQDQWNRERNWIYNTQAGYNNFEGEIQPPHITTPDNYDHLTLEEMQAAVAAMKPGSVDAAVTAWASIGTDLLGSFEVFKREFQRTIDGQGTGQDKLSGWTGAAANAARDAVSNYYEKSVPLATAATVTSLKLSEMQTGIEQTQALMPGLTDRPHLTDKTLPADGVMKADEYSRTEAEAEGRRILRTVYGQVAGQTDVGVPFMPTAPTIGHGTGAEISSVGNGSGTQPNSTTTDPMSNTGSNSGTPSDQSSNGDPSSTQTNQSGDTQPSSTTTAGTNSPGTTSTTSPGTPTTGTPSGTPSPATQSPGTQAPSTLTPATPGRPGSPGIGTPSTRPIGTGTSTSPNAPGRSIPGTPAAGVTPAAAAARPAATTAGRAGMAGMPGMGAPGQGRGGDEERSRGVPDYLITAEHGEELTGLNSQPKAVPPVIGGDSQAN